jgi:hypothetical protein
MDMTIAKKRSIDEQFAATRQLSATIPLKDRYRFTIKDLTEGGFCRFEGLTYIVKEASRYEEKVKGKVKWTWYEYKLFCLETGETVYIEWEEDDRIEVFVTTGEYKLTDVFSAIGVPISADDIEAISEKGKGAILLKGTTFAYDDDCAAVYFRNSTAEGEKVYLYDFESKEGICLTVEEWGSASEGYEYLVYLSKKLNPDEIEIIYTGK